MSGEITPQGAKNEALQVICATLLTSEEVIIDNVPDILDVNNLIALLRKMGVEVRYLGPNRYSFRAADVDIHYMQTDDFRSRASSLRGSIMIMGPLLARYGMAYFPKPGGDKIGRRRLDTHFLDSPNWEHASSSIPTRYSIPFMPKSLKALICFLMRPQ